MERISLNLLTSRSTASRAASMSSCLRPSFSLSGAKVSRALVAPSAIGAASRSSRSLRHSQATMALCWHERKAVN